MKKKEFDDYMQLIENIKKDLKQIRKEIDELKEDDYLNVDREKYFVGDVFIHKGYGKLTVREQEGDYLIMSNWKKFNVSAIYTYLEPIDDRLKRKVEHYLGRDTEEYIENERRRKIREDRLGKCFNELSSAEHKKRIDDFISTIDEEIKFLYAIKYLSLSTFYGKEILFLGIGYKDDNIILRFFTSQAREYYSIHPAYLKVNGIAKRKYCEEYISNRSEYIFYKYTDDRQGYVVDLVLSKEKGFLCDVSQGKIELIINIFQSDEIVSKSKKLTLEYSKDDRTCEITVEANNYFSENEFEMNNYENGKILYGSEEYYDVVDFTEWSLESPLHEIGYNVSQKDGLSDEERQGLIEEVIESKLMSPRQVKELLERQINLRKTNISYRTAIGKWERDLQFLRKYYRV